MRTLVHERSKRPPYPCDGCKYAWGGFCNAETCGIVRSWERWTPEDAYRAHLRWMARRLELRCRDGA